MCTVVKLLHVSVILKQVPTSTFWHLGVCRLCSMVLEEPACELIRLSQPAPSSSGTWRSSAEACACNEVLGDHPQCATAHLQAWQQVLVQAVYGGVQPLRRPDPSKTPKQPQGLQLGSSQI